LWILRWYIMVSGQRTTPDIKRTLRASYAHPLAGRGWSRSGGAKMSFYLRKSIKVGPLRFNLSGSGVGVSAGIRGLRFGVGPRGNYVHMGRSGIYYRATIPPPSSDARRRSHVSSNPEVHLGTHDPLQEIES